MQFFSFPTLIFLACILAVGCNSSGNNRPPVVEDATKLGASPTYSRQQSRSYQASAVKNTSSLTTAVDSGSSGGGSYLSTDNSYTVVKGDTLYSVAFRYGQDYKSLAKLNNIEAPYDIKVGQVLRLNSSIAAAPVEPSLSSKTPTFYIVKSGDTATSVASGHNMTLAELVSLNNLAKPYNLRTGQKLQVSGSSEVPVAGQSGGNASSGNTVASVNTTSEPIRVVTGKTRSVGGLVWMWPAKGKVIQGFSSSEHGNKGVDIAGSRGQDIYAASAGQVVYSGSALRGYGNLIIINHNNEYLSAYAHNERLLVSEGQKVKRGQVIAKMGSTDAKQVQLHFEIRYKGNSVNPQKYLP